MNLENTGRMIAQARKELNMTQKVLADKLGISDKAISKWERGLSFPDVAMLQPISHVLNIPLLSLLSGEQLEDENHNSVTEIIKSTVEISNTELNRKKRQYLKRLIFVGVCVVVVLCILGYPFFIAMQPADSQSRVSEVQAQTFPSNHVLTIQMNTKTNPGDFYAFGFMKFSTKIYMNLMETKLEQIFGKENVTKYHSIGTNMLYSRLLIKQQREDGTTDYYSLVSSGGDGKITEYVFTGMRYEFDYGQNEPVNIILPIHLVGDIRIGERNSITVFSGAEYELHPISIDSGEYENNYLDLFYDFYGSLGWYDVTTIDNSILITPKKKFDEAIPFSIKFVEHVGQTYFSVNIG